VEVTLEIEDREKHVAIGKITADAVRVHITGARMLQFVISLCAGDCSSGSKDTVCTALEVSWLCGLQHRKLVLAYVQAAFYCRSIGSTSSTRRSGRQ
jgi:hypothetical protein